MLTILPSTTVPGGIKLVVTSYNLSGKKAPDVALTKPCRTCGRERGLLEFLVIERQRRINGEEVVTLEESPHAGHKECRDCYVPRTDFYIHKDDHGRTRMRIWALRDAAGAPVRLFDPTSKSRSPWERFRDRGLRQMADGTLRLQPRSERGHASDGTPYGQAKGGHIVSPSCPCCGGTRFKEVQLMVQCRHVSWDQEEGQCVYGEVEVVNVHQRATLSCFCGHALPLDFLDGWI